MQGVLLICLAVGVLAVMLWMLRNATTLLMIEVRDGKITSFRGHAPKGLLRELGDVVATRPIKNARVRIVSQDQRPYVSATGDVLPGELQRMRNVTGIWSIAKIRAAPRRSHRADR